MTRLALVLTPKMELRHTNALYRGFMGFQGFLCSILNLSNICMRSSTYLPVYIPFFVPSCVCTSSFHTSSEQSASICAWNWASPPCQLQGWEGRRRGRRGRQEKQTGAGHYRLERAELCTAVSKRKLLGMSVAAYYSVCT